jgi:hypothetical protein
MFHHVLSSALSTVFDLACVILPAAPLFVVKNLSPSAGSGPEQAQKNALSEHLVATTAKRA